MFYLPIILFTFFTFFIVIVIVRSKKVKGKIFDDSVENTYHSLKEIVINKLKKDEPVNCEYCNSVLPAGTTKCPNCSASIKKSKKQN